jgi:hypothetical protein
MRHPASKSLARCDVATYDKTLARYGNADSVILRISACACERVPKTLAIDTAVYNIICVKIDPF